ncbi:hypothetical protein [Nostoc sp.]|uniref:hypothetical protein n=1 Tax=Nostoc sp. TaxID=1180 RepID=UPI002FF7E119
MNTESNRYLKLDFWQKSEFRAKGASDKHSENSELSKITLNMDNYINKDEQFLSFREIIAT